MLTALQQRYEQLEDARLALIRKVRRLAPRMLNHKPGPDQWSIMEDFQHLVLAEQKMALKIGTVAITEEQNPEMFEMVLQVLDQDIVVDVPDPAMVPDGDAVLDDLIRDWEQARKRLYRFLNACGPDDLDSPVSHHAVAGPLTVVECLRLMAAHVDHHRRRIDAALAHQRGNP
jgi:uncharacterized damage-inducible protein DinB